MAQCGSSRGLDHFGPSPGCFLSLDESTWLVAGCAPTAAGERASESYTTQPTLRVLCSLFSSIGVATQQGYSFLKNMRLRRACVLLTLDLHAM